MSDVGVSDTQSTSGSSALGDSGAGIFGARWTSSILSARGFLTVAGRLLADEAARDQGRSGVLRLAPHLALSCACECSTRLLATVAKSLGSLQQIERLVKLKLTLPEGLSQEERSLIGEEASALLIDLVGKDHGAGERTVVTVAPLPAGVVMEAEAIMRVRDAVST